MDIAFVLPNLKRGGAERQAVLFACRLAKQGHKVTFMVFQDQGPFKEDLLRYAINVVPMAKDHTGFMAIFFILSNFFASTRKSAPEILYSYMPASNVLALLAKLAHRNCRIVWGVRASDMPLNGYGIKTRLAYWLERKLSALPHLIIANSNAGRNVCIEKGYPPSKLAVIPNGFDTLIYRPDAKKRQQFRDVWQLDDDLVAIGMPARLDPVKNHSLFMRAAAKLLEGNSRVRFIVLGGGSEEYGQKLRELETELNLSEFFIWHGEEEDMAGAYNGLDIACLSSNSEGFPNVIGEAMATGIPCVSTDVGDAAFIIGDKKRIVTPGDIDAMIKAWQYLLVPENRISAGKRDRQRIIENFSVTALVEKSLEISVSSSRDAGQG